MDGGPGHPRVGTLVPAGAMPAVGTISASMVDEVLPHPDDPAAPGAARRPRPPSMRRTTTTPTRALAALAGALLLLAVAACSGEGGTAAAGGLPETTLEPIGSGEPTTLDAVAADGQPLVLNVWASFCTPCITEMPDFESVHQALGDQVAIVGVTDDDDVPAAEALAERTGVTYPLYRDPARRLGVALEVSGLPATVFVGPDGTVVERHQGALDADELSSTIERLWGIT